MAYLSIYIGIVNCLGLYSTAYHTYTLNLLLLLSEYNKKKGQKERKRESKREKNHSRGFAVGGAGFFKQDFFF